MRDKKETAPAQGGDRNVPSNHTPIAGAMAAEGFLTCLTIKDSRQADGHPYPKLTRYQLEARAREPFSLPRLQTPAFILTTYCGPDGRNHSVQGEKGKFGALVADVDTGGLSIEGICFILAMCFSNVAYLAYSTASATKDNPRWRIIIWLSALLPGAQYESHQLALFDLLAEHGVECDRAMKGPGQISFYPNVPPERRNSATGEPFFYKYHINDGPLLDLQGSQLAALAQEIREQSGSARKLDVSRNVGEPSADDFATMRNPNSRAPLAEARELLTYIGPDGGRGDWLTVAMGLHDEFEGAEEAYQLFDDWSAGTLHGKQPPNYVGPDDTRRTWDSLSLRRSQS